jgi:DNA-directed RNA polymerase specialized sigma24 family protein
VHAPTPRDYVLFRERYQQLAFRIVLRIVGNHADAEDVCQKVWLKIWRSSIYKADVLARCCANGNGRAYVLTMFCNAATDQLRRTVKKNEFPLAPLATLDGDRDSLEMLISLELEATETRAVAAHDSRQMVKDLEGFEWPDTDTTSRPRAAA